MRILTASRGGLSVAAAVVLLSACGSSGGGDSAARSSEASPSASESSARSSEASPSASGSSARPADSQFCTDAAAVQERMGSALNDQSNPAALSKALQEAAAEIRAVEPPAKIAADWTALADGVEQIATAFGAIDFNDPDALATFQTQVGRLQADLATASTNVENYLRDECGLQGGSSESAAPSS